ncbi:MAG: CBS domain-containing protein [Chloroflexota bacterium]
MKASTVMTRQVIMARPEMSLDEATELLVAHHISGVPVVDEDGQVVGVFSVTDALARQGATVREVMTSPAVCVGPDTTLDEVAAVIVAKDINRVPVVVEGRLVGIIGRADLVRSLACRRAWGGPPAS